MYCQVGIVAVNLLGSDDDFGKSSSPMSGEFRDVPNRTTVSNPLNDLSIDMNLDPSTAEKLRLLSSAKVLLMTPERSLQRCS